MAWQSGPAWSESADPQNSLWFHKINEWWDHSVLPQELLWRPQCALHLLMTLSHLPVPREGYSSGKLRNPKKPKWGGHHRGLLQPLQSISGKSYLQECRQLRYSNHSHGALCKTEQRKGGFWAFLPQNVSAHSREDFILDYRASYFHSFYILL